MAGLNENVPLTPHLPDGSQATFAYLFKIHDKSQLVVNLYAPSSSVPVTIDPSYYTVTGEGTDSGGFVTLSAAYLTANGYPPSGSRLIVKRDVAETIGSGYLPGNPFPATTAQTDFEKTMMAVQELKRDIQSQPRTYDPDVTPTPGQIQEELVEAMDTAVAASTEAESAKDVVLETLEEIEDIRDALQSQSELLSSIETITATATAGQTTISCSALGYTFPPEAGNIDLYTAGIQQPFTRTSDTVITFDPVPLGVTIFVKARGVIYD